MKRLYPEIFLAIDNCFASKRYTEPAIWMNLIRDLGVFNVEASADTECDPLYMGIDYLHRWVDKVREASGKYGVSVCNLYSGHGTYATLGLAHNDPLIRDRIVNMWLKPMIRTAAELEAGLGFFCHAFSNRVLQDAVVYRQFENELINNLSEIARFSHQEGCKTLSVEQMYSPHQVPWTIEGAKDLLNRVFEKSAKPFYITIDTGHQSGQRNFLKPGNEALLKAMKQYRVGIPHYPLWLGTDAAFKLFESCKDLGKNQFDGLIKKIFNDIKTHPYLFAGPVDSSPYKWLEELACYSPIIHLQQTDGKSSTHRAFTEKNNENGIIEGKKILEAIKTSYEFQQDSGIPKADRIYLTIEVFAPTASINYYLLKELRETIRYWRQFIPEDGKKLDELI